MKKIRLLSVLLSAAIIIVSSYALIFPLQQPPPQIIDSQRLSSLIDMNWNQQFPDSKISKFRNNSVGKCGFISGMSGSFELKNNTSTSLGINIVRFVNSTDANNTYINLTNSFFEGFSSHFPYNSTVSNGTIYDLMVQPPNVSHGVGSTINYTSLVAVHKNLFVWIMESGMFFSGSKAVRVLNWEVNANRA